MRRLLPFLLVLLAAGSARAEVPGTRFTILTGPRAGTGALGRAYPFGWLIGTEAGIQPWIWGAAWSLEYTYFWQASSMENVAQVLETVEMDFALRARIPMQGRIPGVPAFVILQTSLDVLRASVPIPPDASQIYVGPSAGGGIEFALGDFMFAVGARYGMIVGGPSSLKFLFSFGVGSK